MILFLNHYTKTAFNFFSFHFISTAKISSHTHAASDGGTSFSVRSLAIMRKNFAIKIKEKKLHFFASFTRGARFAKQRFLADRLLIFFCLFTKAPHSFAAWGNLILIIVQNIEL